MRLFSSFIVAVTFVLGIAAQKLNVHIISHTHDDPVRQLLSSSTILFNILSNILSNILYYIIYHMIGLAQNCGSILLWVQYVYLPS